jgi:acetylornithine deacetylase/succinyl-diaminopimelate desuccinylase-like protein
VDQAHAADEFVPLAEVLSTARVLARVAARFGDAGPWPRLSPAEQ